MRQLVVFHREKPKKFRNVSTVEYLEKLLSLSASGMLGSIVETLFENILVQDLVPGSSYEYKLHYTRRCG
jgi:hypothetical protein